MMILTLYRLFNQEAFSDITVKFGNHERKCHKVILCAKSDYFTQLLGPGKEFAEANRSAVELKGDDEDAIEAMLRWLYTFDYEARGATASLDFHINVAVVANKYLLRDLEQEASLRFARALTGISYGEFILLMKRMYYAVEAYPQSLVAAVDQRRDIYLAGLLKQEGFREMLLKDSTLSLTVINKLSPFAELEKKWWARCSCGCQSIRTHVIPGKEYRCSNLKCNLALPPEAHQPCYVKK